MVCILTTLFIKLYEQQYRESTNFGHCVFLPFSREFVYRCQQKFASLSRFGYLLEVKFCEAKMVEKSFRNLSFST